MSRAVERSGTHVTCRVTSTSLLTRENISEQCKEMGCHMKRFFYLIPMVFLLLLIGCSSVSPFNPDSQLDITATQPASLVEDSGYLYLRLGNVEDQFHHFIVRVPAACLVDQTACDAVEVIPTYPEGGIGQNRLHWSPDHSRAVLLDNFVGCLHSFNPQTMTFSMLLEEPMAGNDDLVWLSSDELVYVRQNGNQTSTLVSMIWDDAEPQITEVNIFEGVAKFLGKNLAGMLYFADDISGQLTGDPSLKTQTVETNILQVDPHTGESIELWLEEDWLSLRPQVVTADGQWLVYGDFEVSMWDLQTGETVLIGENVHWSTPSPDGRWLAAVFREDDLYSLHLLDLETMAWEPIVTLRSIPSLYWSPNSRYLVLARFYEPDLVPGPLIVIDPETGSIFTPQIDLKGYQWVDDVSWGR